MSSEGMFRELHEKLGGKSEISKQFEAGIKSKTEEKQTIKRYMKEKNLQKKQRLAKKLRFKFKLDPAKVAEAYLKHNMTPEPGMWCDSDAACGIGVALFDYFMQNPSEVRFTSQEDEDECEGGCPIVPSQADPGEIANLIEEKPEKLAKEKLGLSRKYTDGFTSGFDAPDVDRAEKLKSKEKLSETEKGWLNGHAVRVLLDKKNMLDLKVT